MAILAMLDDGWGGGGGLHLILTVTKMVVFHIFFMEYSLYGRRDYKRQEALVCMSWHHRRIVHYIIYLSQLAMHHRAHIGIEEK